MSQAPEEKERRKKILKEIILKLHKGLSAEEARDIFEKEVGDITSSEIAELEQSLINEGLSPDEVKKFCNVHALLFKSALAKAAVKEESPAHPLHLFRLENKEIQKITDSLKKLVENRSRYDPEGFKREINPILKKLNGLEIHYTRKEHLLFPFLEKYGFAGPSKVMWGKDNEIRDILRNAFSKIDEVTPEEYASKYLRPLIEEVEGMIFKEENILFPASLEKLKPEDWTGILEDSENIGYAFIEKPKETSLLVQELQRATADEPAVKGGDTISMPSGEIKLDELLCILNTLPVHITFVDKDDAVKYFSETKDKTFVRARSIIGRKVQNCHPPKSVQMVEEILKSFKENRRDHADFWINSKGKLVYIRYFAVRDKQGNYLGCLEVTQDITEIQKIKGEKRLL